MDKSEASQAGARVDLDHTDWMMRSFKTQLCPQDAAMSHDRRCCAFYHCSRDRRRGIDSKATTYSAEPCPAQFDDSRICPQGDACPKAHSSAELLYHPELFRKRLCHLAKRCPRAQFCAFAHCRAELLVPHFGEGLEAQPPEQFILYEFKTQWCPIGGLHDWESCVYAHTYRDWRRTPRIGYSSRPCPHWSRSVAAGAPRVGYQQRCPFGFRCPMAHGAKEQLYHPQFYKTSPCSDPGCHRGALCAFTHEGRDVRCVEACDPNRSTKEPLPGSEPILRLHQPNHAAPPKYHALDEGTQKGQGKQRRRISECATHTTPTKEEQFVDIDLPINLVGTWQSGWNQWSPNYAAGSLPFTMAGWNQWNQMPQEYYQHFQDGLESEWRSLSTWPCNQSVPSSPARTGHEFAEDAPSPQAVWRWNFGCVPAMPLVDAPMLVASAEPSELELVAARPRERTRSLKSLEELLWRRSLAHGMRTPSSFGSPPLSGTATEVPTPRPDYEVALSSQDAASSDVGDGNDYSLEP